MSNVKALKPSTHYIFWSIISVLLIGIVFLLKSMLLPFVAGIAVAYVLNPAVSKLGKLGIKRRDASLLILTGFLILLLTLISMFAPVLIKESGAFIKDMPVYINELIKLLTPFTKLVEKYTGGAGFESVEWQGFLIDNSDMAATVAKTLASKLAAGGQTLIDIISLLLFMPIVAYFMMKEWPAITSWVYDLIPHHAREDVTGLLKQVDEKLSGFIRGQVSVALVLALAYAIALILAGLKYGLMIGVMSGLLSIIPLVGSTLGLIVSVSVAWVQLGEWTFVLLIAGIFIGGQLIEGNILTPKLVGDSVGLHPLWIFFALLAGGSLLGILGMFLAVPVAAVIGVLLSFALKKYKQSAYYQGSSKKSESSQKKKKK
ncbi:MAG: AI-2E family transporter [Alphaproteobacteria bacterium]|nr:AI-2E family transporter [Alphaproteobacteria bacterium]